MKEAMSKQQAIDYCHQHRNEFLQDAYGAGEDGVRMFDCLISCLKYGTIKPEELAKYGMEYEDNSRLASGPDGE